MYIVADIGGTKTRVAGSDDLETFGVPVIFPTPQKYEEALAAITEHARATAGSDSIEKMVVGVPVRLSRDKRTIVHAQNIPDWTGKALSGDLERALGASVVLGNDCALVGLGEAIHGAGQGASILVYMTISTGVNGVRIVDGKIDPSASGFEIGDQYLMPDHEAKMLGDMISGRAIAKRFGVASPRDLGKEHPVWEELAQTLAYAINNTIMYWSPDRIVIGGSMMNDIGIPIDRVKFHLQTIMKDVPMPEIAHASLGDVGGLWGGLVLLRQGFGG
jgi:predicted NBD/HSP70 family sugar kinase